MSLDGYITNPKASPGTSLDGHEPGRLHDWMFDGQTEADGEIVADRYEATGAIIVGRRMFDHGF